MGQQWLILTMLDGADALVPLDKISLISFNSDGNTYILLDNGTEFLVEEEVEEIQNRLVELFNHDL